MKDPSSTEKKDTAKLASGAAEIREAVGEDAARLKHAAEERASQTLDGGRHKAAAAASSAASAIGDAAGVLREKEDAPDWLASALETTAGKISGLARSLDGHTVSDMRHNLNDFARQHPATFLAASAAAGFAVSRFLRAGAAYQGHHDGEGRRSQTDRSAERPDTRQSDRARAPATGPEGVTNG